MIGLQIGPCLCTREGLAKLANQEDSKRDHEIKKEEIQTTKSNTKTPANHKRKAIQHEMTPVSNEMFALDFFPKQVGHGCFLFSPLAM